MFFSVLTKNLNWETLTKNLVTFKRCDGLTMKSFSITGAHLKIRFLWGECCEKLIYWEELPKRGAWQKEGVFLKEGLILQW